MPLAPKHTRRWLNSWDVLAFAACLLIVKVTIGVVLTYRNYLPPNFSCDFLRGRESYFSGSYQWAFYTHIISGPIALLFGLALVSQSFRQRFPQGHRILGRIQGLGVLMLLAPSGMWMARYAEGGLVATCGFAALAVVTATCVMLGWRAAVQRRFFTHRLWMSRGFVLICSAVVIRIVAGVAAELSVHAMWMDQLMSWASWLVPLLAFEWFAAAYRRGDRSSTASPSTPLTSRFVIFRAGD